MHSGILSVSYSESPIGKSNHYHEGHQMLYIVEGEVTVRVDQACETVGNGTLLLFSRFKEHSLTVNSKVYKRYSLRVSPEFGNMRDNELLFAALVNRAPGFCDVIRDKENEDNTELLFRRITEEYAGNAPFREEMLDALLRELLVSVCRRMPKQLLPEQSERARVIYRIQQRFETDYRENFSLKNLAEEYHMSTSYLSHLFKEITGSSVMEYLLACRMLAAKKYLATTELSVGEIVSACGFSDDSNFSRSFRDQNGITPTEFRKRYR
ncbi:MAG: helix-turn-helix transcriptional regulator [Clostridia bacterium]|nr:helix-turn-helix transcriptional regulator [Clostridia bacterium]